jgi:ketosteroid isomerase-like protein
MMGHTWISRVALAGACAALLAGCGGGGDDQTTAREAAQDYVKARNQGDAGRVCELYGDELIQRLGASNCQGYVKEQTAGVATSFALVSVHESGNRATATIRATVAGTEGGGGRLRISLERRGGEWKITSLGANQDAGVGE